MAALELEDLSVAYGDLTVLESVSLSVDSGQFVTLLGPSGAGKSTLFHALIGGVEHSGTIHHNGAQADRGYGYMPQKDLLFPWRTLVENASLGLEVRGLNRKQARRQVRELLPAFGLDGFADAYPTQLSGGMRQRAALLRTVAQGCDVLLLDEPFGALDALTRTKMQEWLAAMHSRYGWTILLVTHDLREAITLSDRICVLSKAPGRIVAEIDVPLRRPRDRHTITDPQAVAIEAELLDLLWTADG